MRALAVVVLTIMVLATSSLAPAAEKVTVYGDDSYPPYSYLDPNSKTPAGIYVEILQAIFAKMPDFQVTIELLPWKRGLNMIEVGQALAMFPPYASADRDPWMVLSQPILPELIVVYGTEEKLRGKSQWPEDFLGSTIAVNSGFTTLGLGGQAFDDAIKAGKIILDDQGKSNSNCLKKLAAGRVDFYINDRLIDISETPEVKRSEIVTQENHGHLGFTRRTDKFPSAEKFRATFNEALQEAKQSGIIDEVLKKKR